jgi:hypothetical protein
MKQAPSRQKDDILISPVLSTTMKKTDRNENRWAKARQAQEMAQEEKKRPASLAGHGIKKNFLNALSDEQFCVMLRTSVATHTRSSG